MLGILAGSTDIDADDATTALFACLAPKYKTTTTTTTTITVNTQITATVRVNGLETTSVILESAITMTNTIIASFTSGDTPFEFSALDSLLSVSSAI